jgi:glutamate racemase
MLLKSCSVMNSSILFIDSGIGGLPYLEWARRRLAEEHFIYIADRAHFPYGTKEVEQIREAILQIALKAVSALDPKIVVLACNTATMVAIDALRERFSIPFIGVVPAVKPAAALTGNGRVGLIASGRAVKDTYLKHLISNHAHNCDIQLVPADEVIDFVEMRYVYSTKEETLQVIERAIRPLKDRGIDTLVLACTHLLIMEKEFRQVLGKEIRVVDSRQGVVNQLIRVMDTNGLRENGDPRSQPTEHLPPKPHHSRAPAAQAHRFYVTGDAEPEERYAIISDRFGLDLAGCL